MVSAILSAHKETNLESFVFYGANKKLQTGINLAKPFMPFKIKITNNLETALSSIKYNNSAEKKKSNIVTQNKQNKKYVEDLLVHLNSTNWKNNGKKESIDINHPFSEVFDAIDLIKWEFEDLLENHKKAEEKIKHQLDEKKIILKEVHHRIKNNFASMESLLSLQANST